MPILRLVALTALLSLGPATAAWGYGWTAPQTVSRSGLEWSADVAADARGNVAVGFARQLDGVRRAELRRGTMRSGISGGSLVLDRTSRALDRVVVGYPAGSGAAAVAWLRYLAPAHRLWAALVPPRATAAPAPQHLTGPAQSAYEPAFAGTALTWTRRTMSASSRVVDGLFRAPVAAPPPGVGSTPSFAALPDDRLVTAWAEGGAVRFAQEGGDGAWGPVQALWTAAAYAREPWVASGSGAVAVVWLASVEGRNAVLAAIRPPGETAFRAPVEVAPPSENARSPRVVITSAGEITVAWVATDSAIAYDRARGPVHRRRLTPAGAFVGPVERVTAQETYEPALATDPHGAYVAWTQAAAPHAVRARRFAPGGIAGRILTVSAASDTSVAPALAAAPSGGAVLGWVQRGDVQVSRYRL